MPNLSAPIRVIAFFITVLLALLAALGVGVTYAYRDRYYPAIKVGGVPVGGLSREAAAAKVKALAAAFAAKEVTVALPNIGAARDPATGQYPTTEIRTTAGELQVAVPAGEVLDQAWAVGRASAPLAWIREVTGLFFSNGRQIALAPRPNEGALKEFVATKVVAAASPPQPARVAVEGKEVKVADQQPGLAIDSDELLRRLGSALATGTTAPLAIRLPEAFADSPVTRGTVEPLAAQLTALGNTRLSLKGTGVTLAPARDELLQWFIPVQSDTGEVALSVSSERIGAYLQKTKTLDQKKSLEAVKAAAEAWLKEPRAAQEVALTVKPTAVATPGEYKAGLFEGKYVYINLRDQKLYRMNGQTMEKVYRVSTGKWSTPTPRGTFRIGTKVTRAYSRAYGLYMPYWQNFLGISTGGEDLPVGSYGLHELPEWPNGYKEGQGHLGTAVSHGCVRLGVGDAHEVYDWTESGTPVVIE